MTIKHTVKVGQKVRIRPGFNTGSPITVTVDDLDEKNGRPLFGYTDEHGNSEHWAYESQICSERFLRVPGFGR